MAYSNLTATSVNDALDKFQAFAVTNGWTSNSYIDDSSYYFGNAFTGKRSHLTKTGSTNTAYVNMRSSTDQVCFERDLSSARVTGININISTGYNGSNAWDYQPGAPVWLTESVGGNTGILYNNTAGAGDAMKASSIDCHFFAANSGNVITGMFQSVSSNSTYLGISFGFTSLGLPYYLASCGLRVASSVSEDSVATAHCFIGQEDSNYSENNGYAYDGTTMRRYGSSVSEYTMQNRIGLSLNSSTGSDHILEAEILGSVDSMLGNRVLFPNMIYTGSVTNIRYGLGETPGIKLINMENLNTLDTVTYGSDDYILFRMDPRTINVLGVALLK